MSVPSLPREPFPHTPAYRSVTEEIDTELSITGRLPADLEGVLFNNGAGRYHNASTYYEHPFDGDGMLKRLTFRGGRVHYKNRFVRTRELLDELRAGRMLYRAFGTNIPGGLSRNLLKFRFKNASNTSALFHAGRLFTMWEGGLPHELDPRTLETLGRCDFDGMLRGGAGGLRERLVDPELSFSAHPLTDPGTGELFNFGVSMSGKPTLLLYRLRADGTPCPVERVPLSRRGYMHAFALSESYRIFFVPALSFHMAPMVLGTKTLLESLSLDATYPSEVLLVHRETGEVVRFEVPSTFVLHYANAFEDGSRVIVDGLPMPSLAPPEAFRALMRGDRSQFPFPKLTRYTFDLRTREVTQETLSEHPAELPKIHPARVCRPYRYTYCLTVFPNERGELIDGVVKIDVEGRTTERLVLPDHTYVGEPLFVPRPAGLREDDGYVLVFGYRHADAVTSLLVLDARTLDVLAEARLPHQIPPPFHGQFVSFEELGETSSVALAE